MIIIIDHWLNPITQMYDLFKRQRQKKSNLPPFPIKVKKKKLIFNQYHSCYITISGNTWLRFIIILNGGAFDMPN